MESDRENTTPVRYVARIVWSQTHKESLLEAEAAVDPNLKGAAREKELEKAWYLRNPSLASKGKALTQQLYRMKAKVQKDRREGQTASPNEATGPNNVGEQSRKGADGELPGTVRQSVLAKTQWHDSLVCRLTGWKEFGKSGER